MKGRQDPQYEVKGGPPHNGIIQSQESTMRYFNLIVFALASESNVGLSVM